MRIAAFLLLVILSAGSVFAEPYMVKQGDTLSKILETKYTPLEITRVAAELKAAQPSFVLRPGMIVDIEEDSVSIQISVDKDAFIYKEDGIMNVSLMSYEWEIMPTVVSGTIISNLFNAVRAVGEDAELAARLARIYEWEFDFFKDIREGDSFTVLVEKCFVRGKYVGYGKILAADFKVKGKAYKAFRYAEGDKFGYYNENASSLERGFLRVPLSYSRISSRFSGARMHPVLGEVRPHYGVDYAAPIGTPVMATASGTVSQKTYNKASGNFIELKHNNGYRTYYLHLSKFADIKVGSKVEQGQVIGYVGSTGYSTGPHLDYRIKHNNTWLDPLTFVAEAPKLSEEFKGDFFEIAAARTAMLRTVYQNASNMKYYHLQ